MPTTDYRPKIGETVFVSLSENIPLLITVTGFHYHTYLKEEVMDFMRLDGSANWSTYKGQQFFPKVSIETPYLYVLLLDYDDDNYLPGNYDDEFFFTPEAAFSYLETLGSKSLDYIVEVRKVS